MTNNWIVRTIRNASWHAENDSNNSAFQVSEQECGVHAEDASNVVEKFLMLSLFRSNSQLYSKKPVLINNETQIGHVNCFLDIISFCSAI